MSATVFAVTIAACIAIFTTVIIFLMKSKSRLQAELESHRSSTKVTQNYDEVVPVSQPDSTDFDTRKILPMLSTHQILRTLQTCNANLIIYYTPPILMAID